jgi:hypothetical protein
MIPLSLPMAEHRGMPVISSIQGSINRKIMVQVGSDINTRPYPQNIKAK